MIELRSARAARTFLFSVALAFLCFGCPQPKMKCLQIWADTGLCPGAPIAQNFFEFPWPNDVRKKPDGTIDFTGFPNTSDPNAPLTQLLKNGTRGITAFGNNAAIYFTISDPIDTNTLPKVEDSKLPSSNVILVNIQPGPNYGKQVPIEVVFRPDASPRNYRPANMLTLLPFPGSPLAEGERYAAILFNGIKLPDGSALGAAELIGKLNEVSGPGTGVVKDLKEQLAAVNAYATANPSWEPNQVIGFTVFTTQRPSRVTNAVRRTIDGLTVAAGQFGDISIDSRPEVVQACPNNAAGSRAIVQGSLWVPRFQNGTPPYNDGGGEIELETVGGVEKAKIPGGWEQTLYQLVVPCQPRPSHHASGWPVVVVVGVTGSSFTNAQQFSDVFYAGKAPEYAVLSIAPYFSGNRLAAGQDSGLTFFNFLNPVAGRNNQRQQGAEIAYMARVAQRMAISGANRTALGLPEDFITNDAELAFYGHSHGAVPGPIGLATTDRYRAAFLNAPGGGLYHTLVYRFEARAAVDALAGTLLDPLPPNEIDEFHPIVHAMQTMAEEGDAANYADDMNPNMHVMMTGGVLNTASLGDGCSIFEGVAHVAAAAGLQLGNYSFTSDFYNVFAINPLGRSTVDLPTHNNLPSGTPGGSGRLGVLLELPGKHYVVWDNPGIVRAFFDPLFYPPVPLFDFVHAPEVFDTPPTPTPAERLNDGCNRIPFPFLPPLPISELVTRAPPP